MAEVQTLVPKSKVSLLDLPSDPLWEILSYLDPAQLQMCASTCTRLRSEVREGPFWKVFCPTQWAMGIWDWNPICESAMLGVGYYCDKIPYGQNATNPFLITQSQADQYNIWTVMGYTILTRILCRLTPIVGVNVRELHMCQCESVTDILVRVALVQCPNIELLDINKTSVSDEAFTLLPDYNACRNLKVVDLSESLVGDAAIAALAACWTVEEQAEPGIVIEEQIDAFSIPCVRLTSPGFAPLESEVYTDRMPNIQITTYKGGEKCKVSGVRKLNLSSCGKISDASLHSLMGTNVTVTCSLEYLNVSGTGVTGKGLNDFVEVCPRLNPKSLYYCDHIDGPYQREANGCSNLQGIHCCVHPEY